MDDNTNPRRLASPDGDFDPSQSDAKSVASDDRQKPLTHRPRDLAKLNPATLSSVSPTKINSRRPETGRDQSTRFDMVTPSPDTARSADLKPFADQLISIANQLRSGDFHHTSGTPPRDADAAPLDNDQFDPRPDLIQSGVDDLGEFDPDQRRQAFAEMARLSYAKRRKRVTIFGDPELFGEPAWDILLDLYIAQAEGKSVSVSSACIGSASPPTTGLRWLGVLADQGLLEREHDPQDQRRVLVRLTEKALDAMDEYFAGSVGLSNDRRSARA